jgi:hypothetical protein
MKLDGCADGDDCAMAILAMPEHGRDARGISSWNSATRLRLSGQFKSHGQQRGSPESFRLLEILFAFVPSYFSEK